MATHHDGMSKRSGTDYSGLEVVPHSDTPVHPNPSAVKSPSWVKTKRKLVAIIVIVLIIIIVICVVLPLKLTKKENNSSPPPPDLPSTGPIQYSGVTALDFDDGTKGMRIYYQVASGQIEEWINIEGEWTKGLPVEIPPEAQARPGTPLGISSYENQGERVWHLFYIDRQNYLQELINSNRTQTWHTGSLGSSKFVASKSNTTGLTACTSPLYGSPFGIHLYFGDANTNAIQQLNWTVGRVSWDKGHTFTDTDPDGGCECTRRGSSITYLWLSQLLNSGESAAVKNYWYDFNLTTNYTGHATGEWVEGPLDYAPVKPHTAISAITQSSEKRHVIAQHGNNTVAEIIVASNAEMGFIERVNEVTKNAMMPYTKTTCRLITTEIGVDLHVWLQLESSNGTCYPLKEYARGVSTLLWAEGELDVDCDVGQ